MSTSWRTEIIDPATLSASERDDLAADLFQVQSEIFGGVDRAGFQRYVVDSTAEQNRLAVLRGEDGRPLGYAALHFFELEMDGRPTTVIRTEVGYTRALRGQNPVGRFGVSTTLGYVARNPRRDLYFLGCPVHPASYLAAARWSPNCWPRHDAPVPDAEQALMCRLADRFGLEAPGDDPLVRRVGWITRQTDAERSYWARSARPEVRYYLERNPGYTEGDGLLLLVPLDLISLGRSVGRWLQGRSVRRAFELRASVDRVFGGSSADIESAVSSLHTTALFRDAPDDALRTLAEAARTQAWPSGSWVFRQGELGDALYVVLEGSAYVLIDEADERRVVDHLGPGDVFGEMALVTGAPRVAGVRAARNLKVLRMGREALDAAHQGAPSLADALWRNVGRLRLDNLLPQLPGLDEMSRAQRIQWFDDGVPWAEGARDEGWLWLFEGGAAVPGSRGVAWISAPSIAPAHPDTRLLPGARARWLPPRAMT